MEKKEGKLKTLAKLIWSDLWGLLLMIVSFILINLIFKVNTHLYGFITGVVFGAIVWFLLSRKKHWLMPVGYTLILFAHLVTRRAVEVGIAGFYFNEWYSSAEIMILIAMAGTIILYKLLGFIRRSEKPVMLYQWLTIILVLILLFLTGANSVKIRETELIFGKSSNLMIQQLFTMKNEISALTAPDVVDMAQAEQKLNFNFENTPVLMEAFFPAQSPARSLSNFFRNDVKNYIFAYDQGVRQGWYAAGKSDKDRLLLINDMLSGLAKDINSTYGNIGQTEKVFIELRNKFGDSIKK